MSYSAIDCITNSLKFSISINNNNNVIIGHNSYDPIIKNYTNCNIIGNHITTTGNNQVQLGNTLSNVYTPSGIQNTSDQRDKTFIRDTILGLNFIKELRPIDFKWNYRTDYITTTNDYEIVNGIRRPVQITIPNDGSKTRNRYHHGLLAQEVKTIITNLGIDFGGYQDHNINGGDDQLTISYTELIGPMIKAIQELHTEIEILKTRLTTLENNTN